MIRKGLRTVGLAFALVSATPHVGWAKACATDLANCYVAASTVDNFWYRWAAGIDCELEFVQCVRGYLIG